MPTEKQQQDLDERAKPVVGNAAVPSEPVALGNVHSTAEDDDRPGEMPPPLPV